jgi:protein gp37
MSGDSKIEWTDATWNPTRGCAIRSPGCKNCYAMRDAWRFHKPGESYAGLVVKESGVPDRPVWTGEVRLVPEVLDFPLRRRTPSDIFVDSMSDLFYGDEFDREQAKRRGVPFTPVPFEFIAAVFGVMAASSWHRFQVLTKRPSVARAFFDWLKGSRHGELQDCLWYASKEIGIEKFAKWMPFADKLPEFPLANVWLGVSVEDKARRDRIAALRCLPAAVRFVSFEPLLEDVVDDDLDLNGIDWAIMGGESGPRARPLQVEWLQRLVAACRASETAPFVKQLGARVSMPFDDSGQRIPVFAGRKGEHMRSFPADLRVREYPLGA